MTDDTTSGTVLPPSERQSIEPSAEQLALVGELDEDEPVTMLNLLRFRDVADYTAAPGLAGDEAVSGAEAYVRYGEAAWPHLERAEAEVLYQGPCGPTIIGPPDERWDMILLVRYPSPAAFVAMVTTAEYQKLSGHRTAALADSRLVATSRA